MSSSARRRVVGVDVDGVLADFVSAFALKCAVMTGKRVRDVATCWNWVRQDGVTPEEEETIWHHIADNPAFWMGLAPYPDTREVIARLNLVSNLHDLYYITTRPAGAKEVTEDWLLEMGAETPTVLVTNQKGKVCQALGVTTFIDDRPENVLEVYRALPCEAHVYLFSQPWNADWRKGVGEWGIRVVNGWEEFWEREGL